MGWFDGLDAVGAFLVGNAALKYVMMLGSQGRRPPTAKLVGHVTELNIHPIKSMKALQQEFAFITSRGVASPRGFSDRQFMIIDAEGNPINQKTDASLATVMIDVQDNHFVLTATGMEELRLPLCPSYQDKDIIRAWKDSIEAVDCGDAPADWFCRYLNKNGLRLLYSSPNMKKRSPLVHGKTQLHRQARPDDMMAFSGSTAFLMTNQASLDDLNKRMEKSLDMRNFRANIVISGKTPYEEDDWGEVYIGEQAKFSKLLPCGRCVITTIDPDTGVKYADKDPLRTLSTYRKVEPQIPTKAMFGVYLVMDRPGPVEIRDPVYVIKKH